jgi:3-oxoacyl-[acyl-carrier-protein] synthase-1/3-oxoacyl-[acyl-carrier-protein] synthase II
MNPDAIVISGIGIVSPLGHDRESTWSRLLQGASGIDTIRSFDASAFPTRIAAEVKQFDAHRFGIAKKQLRQSLPFMHYAFVAAEEALTDANTRPKETNSERWGCVLGSGMMSAEYQYWLKFQKQFAADGRVDDTLLASQGIAQVDLSDFAKTQSNAALGLLLQQHHIRGYATSVHTACSSSGQAIGLALRALRRGDVDTVLTGGFDSMINPFGVASFCLLGALSTYNDTPQTASRPFDATRNGFVLGEGAAFLVLEKYHAAKARGAKIYAELAGEGNSLSAYRITDIHPQGDGPIQAISAAIQDAGESIERIDYINAHGTSTKMNDLSETNAIKHVLGTRAKQIAISSTKSQTGHLIAGAGAIEASLTALAIQRATIPMTANLRQADPECDLDYVAEGPRRESIRVALSNSIGFGGSNSCLVLRQVEE